MLGDFNSNTNSVPALDSSLGEPQTPLLLASFNSFRPELRRKEFRRNADPRFANDSELRRVVPADDDEVCSLFGEEGEGCSSLMPFEALRRCRNSDLRRLAGCGEPVTPKLIIELLLAGVAPFDTADAELDFWRKTVDVEPLLLSDTDPDKRLGEPFRAATCGDAGLFLNEAFEWAGEERGPPGEPRGEGSLVAEADKELRTTGNSSIDEIDDVRPVVGDKSCWAVANNAPLVGTPT